MPMAIADCDASNSLLHPSKLNCVPYQYTGIFYHLSLLELNWCFIYTTAEDGWTDIRRSLKWHFEFLSNRYESCNRIGEDDENPKIPQSLAAT